MVHASYNNIMLTVYHSDGFFTITFKNNLEVMVKAIQMHHEYLEMIKASDVSGDWTIQTMFQPIPSFFSEHSVEKGGNMLGLERFDENLIRKSPQRHAQAASRYLMHFSTLS